MVSVAGGAAAASAALASAAESEPVVAVPVFDVAFLLAFDFMVRRNMMPKRIETGGSSPETGRKLAKRIFIKSFLEICGVHTVLQ